MAVNKKSRYVYTDEADGLWSVTLSATRAAAGGFPLLAQTVTKGRWPYGVRKMRHVQVLFGDGSRGSFAIAKNDGKYDVGGDFPATISGEARLGGVVTSRTGERFKF